jgi:hypothetical protein
LERRVEEQEKSVASWVDDLHRTRPDFVVAPLQQPLAAKSS